MRRPIAAPALALLIPALLPPLARSTDQTLASEYEVKAAFIYHFTRYLQWPQPEAWGSFEIAILGDSAIVPPLQAIAAKRTVQQRPIAIRPIADIDALGQPHILFLARPAAPRLSRVLEKTRGRPILTIAEEEGLAARGIAMNFVLRGESVKFEVNEAVLRRSVIQPGSQLLKLAILVRGPL